VAREPIDRVTTSVISKDHRYEMIDLGLLFRNFHKLDISSGGTGELLIKTGSKYTHMILDSVADGDTLVQIYGGTTTSDDGTLEPSGNFNFNSSNIAVTTMYSSPTITDDGTYIARTYMLGGSGSSTPAQAHAAASMQNLDIVLTPNSNFMVRFTNEAGRDIQVLFEMTFAEREHDAS